MDLISRLSPYLFWDTDPKEIDPEKHRRWIIERVVKRGNLEDFRLMMKYYTREQIVQSIKEIRSMDEKTLYFLSNIFDVPINEFRCYKEKLLKDKHWNY